MTKSEVVQMYNELFAHAKEHEDGQGNTNAPADLAKIAFDGVRTNVHFALQCDAGAPPAPHTDDDGDPEMHHMRQKAHFKKLWKQTDEIVASAGLTEKGLVS